MSVQDQYIELLEARVEALEKELQLMTDWICRDNRILRGLSPEITLDQFKCYKEGVKETETTL